MRQAVEVVGSGGGQAGGGDVEIQVGGDIGEVEQVGICSRVGAGDHAPAVVEAQGVAARPGVNRQRAAHTMQIKGVGPGLTVERGRAADGGDFNQVVAVTAVQNGGAAGGLERDLIVAAAQVDGRAAAG